MAQQTTSNHAAGVSHSSRRLVLRAIAKAYTDCVELEERSQREYSSLAEDLAVLRSDLHALWMQALRDAGISFIDRADAARLAYELL